MRRGTPRRRRSLSGWPIRPSVTSAVRLSNSSFSPPLGASPTRPGVSTGPGTSVFTLMPRPGQLRRPGPAERADGGLATRRRRRTRECPCDAAVDPERMTDAPEFSSGSTFCTVKSVPATLRLKVSCHVLDGGVGQRRELTAARVGEHHVQAAAVRRHRVDDGVQLGGSLTSLRTPVADGADRRHRGVDRGLVAAGEEDVRAGVGQGARRGQPDACGAAGDERVLAVQ